MPKLYRLPHSAPTDPAPSPILIRDSTVEPTHEEIMEHLSPPSGIWEHVSVLLDDRRMHLFCDDSGHAFNLPINLRASLCYLSATIREPYTLSHILKEEKDKFITFDDYTIMRRRSLLIVGDALLWTGEMT
jgi:hypothetical protein